MLVQIFTEITNMNLTIIPIFLVILAARFVLHRFAPKKYAYFLWAIILFRLLCPITIESPVSVVNERVSSGEVLEHFMEQEVAVTAPSQTIQNDTINNSIENTPQIEQQATPTVETSIIPAVSVIWICGSVVLISYSIISLIKLRKKLEVSIPVRDNIYLADYIDTPFVLGLFNTKIYLPSSLSEKEQDYIVRHEQYHLKRKDHIIKFAAFLALCVHWMNPLVWCAFVLASKDMEMSCDEAVLKEMGVDIREEYSSSLLNMATGKTRIVMTPLAFGEGDTSSRIKNVLKWKKPVLIWSGIAAVLCIIVAVCCIPNSNRNTPKPFHEITSAIDSETIAELHCTIYPNGRDDTSSRKDFALIAYPELKEEFVSILNQLEKSDITLESIRVGDFSVNLLLKDKNNTVNNMSLIYYDGVVSFIPEYESEYAAGVNKEWQTTDAELVAFIEKIVDITEGSEPYITDMYSWDSYESVFEPYYKMSDGTYKTKDYTYQFCYKRTGKISETAAGYSTYIILSNEQNVTFDEAALSQYSSDSNSFFNPEISKIVAVETSTLNAIQVPEESKEFEDILGYDGHYEVYDQEGFKTKKFYTQYNYIDHQIAETWGDVDEYYSIDVDQDGINELICNVTFSDGLQQTLIYKRTGDTIYQGYCDDMLDVKYDNVGYTSEYSCYLPSKNIVRIFYYDVDWSDYLYKDYEIDPDKIHFSKYAYLGD